MRTMTTCFATAVATILLSGCHSKAPQASAQNVDAARQDAQREIADARTEAAKDVKSATKTGGGAKGVTEAKTEGVFDVAMAKADGDHKIAAEHCLTLPADQQQACKTQADTDFDTAAADAKTARVARRH